MSSTYERCNAQSLDVWISSINPLLLSEQQWEDIIGETKTRPNAGMDDLYDMIADDGHRSVCYQMPCIHPTLERKESGMGGYEAD